MSKTILVVDDNEINRKLLRRILSSVYEVMEAEDGETAVALLMKHHQRISAVLLDIVMPVMNGYEVLEKIQRNPVLSQIPIIVITGNVALEAEKKALDLGATDFIIKPFDAEIILRRLNNIIKLRESAALVNTLRRDKLTGLWNRETFFEKAAWQISRQPEGYYVLSCVDIDNFKVINDQYGTEKGDEVLRNLGAVIERDCNSNGGLCGRITADNFAVLYPLSSLHTGGVERLKDRASVIEGLTMPITLSTGRYIVTDRSLSVSAMYDRASIAQESVKGRYGDHVAVYDESMRSNILHEQEIVSSMNKALAEKQYEAWFQPQYNHATGALIGAEALARWRDPARGLIPPGSFIPVFERNGFIYELDKYIWEQVCALLRKWIDEGRSPLPVSVNISRFDLFCDDLVSVLLGLIEKYGVPVELLRLEITESAFAQSADRVVDVVKALIAHGFTVEIDDFGSGYSSLNTLKDVPAQVLKLDMRFLEGSDNTDRGGNILESIVRMAKWLGMSVIAEGVERIEQADYLESIGCVYIQGYLYAKPMPVQEYEALARKTGKEEKLLAMEAVETFDNNAFWSPESMDTLIFNSYVGGACIFEWHDGHIEMLRANEKYVETICKNGSVVDVLQMNWQDHMDAETARATAEAIEKTIQTGEAVTYDAVYIDLPGAPGKTYLRTTFRAIARASDRYLIYATNENMTAQRLADERLHVIMHNMGDGVSAAVMEGDVPKYIFANGQFYAMLGYTKAQYDSELPNGIKDIIYPEDFENVSRVIRENEKADGTAPVEYRVKKRDGSMMWMHANGTVCHMEGIDKPVHITVHTDITRRKLALEAQDKKDLTIKETMSFILSAIMKSSNDFAFAKDKDFRYLCCSPAFLRLVRLEDENDVVGKTDFDLFPADTAEQFRQNDIALFKGGEPFVDYKETVRADDSVYHYCRASKYILRDSAGEIIGLYGDSRDITAERTAFDQLKLLTDSIPGGIASYTASPDGIKINYFNDGYCKMMGYSREEYEKISATGITNITFAEDVPRIMAQIEELRLHGTPMDCTYRIHTKDGGFIWVNLRGIAGERRGDECDFHLALFDITAQKLTEEALRVHEEELKLAMSQMNKMICEYDPHTHVLTVPEVYAARFGIGKIVPNIPNMVTANDFLDKAHIPIYMEFYNAIQRGDPTGEAEYQEKWADGTIHWARMEFSSIFDAKNKPIKAIIAVEDTTEQHRQYELERGRIALGETNLLVHALFNVTTGETLEYAYRDGTEVPLWDRTAFTYGENTIDNCIIDEADRIRYRELTDPASLAARFERGETTPSFTFRRKQVNGKILWTRLMMRLMRDPSSDDLLFFAYFYDVEDEKIRELILNSLVGVGYDCVVCINGRNRTFSVISDAVGLTKGLPPRRGVDSDATAMELVELNIHPDDREMVKKYSLLSGIRENLAKQERFQFSFRTIDPDGSIRNKKLTQYYIDREMEIIVVSREDVTQIMREETEKSAALTAALQAAKQASLAKTAFLSRMSHELRTPMNAIIGLSALSASELEDTAAMRNNIDKIGVSARYLLSLINDILEMSRIESGRMTLSEEPFDFMQLVAGVNSIIRGQAQEKHLSYDVHVQSGVEPVYVGDVTKIQEILVNVLGNAIKFTPAGGRIALSIEQTRCMGDRAALRFVIADNGVGIDKEFLPHIFDAFSQESASLTSTSTGTGLGLGITQKIAELMEGKISVKSEKGKGSTFTIDIQLGVLSGEDQMPETLAAEKLADSRALVVDSDAAACKAVADVLHSMGMQAEWTDSGAQALECAQNAKKEGNAYHTFFVNLKMPKMDGVETARRLRRLVGGDARIVIMTAYDRRIINERAQEAGADMFMEKPITRASLVKAFNAMAMTEEKKAPLKPSALPDFSNKRILLAEDHPLNVEVAKRMLEKVGAAVTVAHNGQEALELFSAAPACYFDAILMDIRMPVMDGLAAAKAIRKLARADSSLTPIIAMTANAFDEDRELSLQSGMNAHLAKPIEPQVLFATLKRLMGDD